MFVFVVGIQPYFKVFCFFFSASCVSVTHETPPTALILDATSGGHFSPLPHEPSSPADVTNGVTLKAPQVGTPPQCETVISPPSSTHILGAGTCLGCAFSGPTPNLLYPGLWSGTSHLCFYPLPPCPQIWELPLSAVDH